MRFNKSQNVLIDLNPVQVGKVQFKSLSLVKVKYSLGMTPREQIWLHLVHSISRETESIEKQNPYRSAEIAEWMKSTDLT